MRVKSKLSDPLLVVVVKATSHELKRVQRRKVSNNIASSINKITSCPLIFNRFGMQQLSRLLPHDMSLVVSTFLELNSCHITETMSCLKMRPLGGSESILMASSSLFSFFPTARD